MKIDQTWIVYEKLDFPKLLDEFKSIAWVQRTALLNGHLEIERQIKWKNFFIALTCSYINLSLFPDKDIIEEFRKNKVSKYWLKWMISWDEIELELKKIETRNILVLRYPLLFLIKSHLKIKIVFEMQEWADLNYKINNKEVSGANKIIFDTYRQRTSGRSKRFRDLEDLKLNKKMDELEATVDRATVKSSSLAFARGNTKFILKLMMDSFINKNRLSEADYCDGVYDFFRMIMKDDPLMYSEDEFLKVAPDSYSSYKSYRHSRIRDLFLI